MLSSLSGETIKAIRESNFASTIFCFEEYSQNSRASMCEFAAKYVRIRAQT